MSKLEIVKSGGALAYSNKALEGTQRANPEIPRQMGTDAKNDLSVINLFLQSKDSKATVATYHRAIADFFEFTDNRPLAAVTVDDLENYKQHLSATHKSAHSRKLKLNAVKSLLTYAFGLGYLLINVGRVVKAEKAVRVVEDKVLTQEQVILLLSAIQNVKHRLIVRLLYATGGRITELCNLQWRDIQDGYIIFRETKSGQPRRVGISKQVAADLVLFRPEGASPDHYVFHARGDSKSPMSRYTVNSALDYMVKQAVKRPNSKRKIEIAGITKLHPHMFRHSHASHAIANGANILIVRDTLGHESVRTTDIYSHAAGVESSGDFLRV